MVQLIISLACFSCFGTNNIIIMQKVVGLILRRIFSFEPFLFGICTPQVKMIQV